MLALLVALVVLALALTGALWFATLFLQSSIYTEPSPGLFWQAPLAAVVMTFFFLFWSLLNVWGSTTTAGRVEVPYGVLWEFSPRVDVIAEPVPELVSKSMQPGSQPAVYKLDKLGSREPRYKKVGGDEYWDAYGIEYVRFMHDDTEYNFVYDKTRGDSYRVFVDEKTGFEMREFEIGRVGYFSVWRVLVYLTLTGLHLLLWIVCFWLVLRFQLWHAVGLGLVMWMAMTMTVLPGLCARAAAV